MKILLLILCQLVILSHTCFAEKINLGIVKNPPKQCPKKEGARLLMCTTTLNHCVVEGLKDIECPNDSCCNYKLCIYECGKYQFSLIIEGNKK